MCLAQPGLSFPAGVLILGGLFCSLVDFDPSLPFAKWICAPQGEALEEKLLLLKDLLKGSVLIQPALISVKWGRWGCTQGSCSPWSTPPWNSCSWNSCLSPLAPCKVHFSCLAFPWGVGGDWKGGTAWRMWGFLCTRLMFINHPGDGFCPWLHESF